MNRDDSSLASNRVARISIARTELNGRDRERSTPVKIASGCVSLAQTWFLWLADLRLSRAGCRDYVCTATISQDGIMYSCKSRMQVHDQASWIPSQLWQ